MKYNKYLIISTLTLIILVTTLFYTKNIFYLYLTIPICIYVSFIKFYQEKDKLLVKTNKILNLLKLESIIYTTAMLILYLTIMFSYILKIQKVEYLYIAYSITAILLLLYAVINIKRTLLIRKTILNKKKEISSLSNWFLNFSCAKIFIKWVFYIFYSYYTY